LTVVGQAELLGDAPRCGAATGLGVAAQAALSYR
jgi:hypothetical protein